MVNGTCTPPAFHRCSDPVFNNSALWFSYAKGSHYLAATTACLSAAGSLLIIISFLALRDLRRATSRQILVFLSVADLGASITNTVGTVHFLQGSECKAQAFFTVFWSLSFVLWSTSMAIYLYVSIVQDNVVRAKKLLIPFHVVCWGLPLLMAVIALAEGALGSSSSTSTVGWCWIAVEPKTPASWACADAQMLWMLLTLKMWELISYAVIPLLYLVIRSHIRKETGPGGIGLMSQSLRQAVLAIDKKLLIFPPLYVLLRLGGSVRVIIEWHMQLQPADCDILSGKAYTALMYIQAFGDNAQGLANFILFFCLTDTILRSLHRVLARLCHQPYEQHKEPDSEKENDPMGDTRDKSFALSSNVQTERSPTQSSSRSTSYSGGLVGEKTSLVCPSTQRNDTQYGVVSPR